MTKYWASNLLYSLKLVMLPIPQNEVRLDPFSVCQVIMK